MKIITIIITIIFLFLNCKIYAQEKNIKKININENKKKFLLNFAENNEINIKEIVNFYKKPDILKIKVLIKKNTMDIKIDKLKKIRNIYIFGDYDQYFLKILKKNKIIKNKDITLFKLEKLRDKLKKNIYKKGIITHINVKIKNIENNKIDLYLNVNVTKKPLEIKNIIVTGNKKISKDAILKVVSLYNFKNNLFINSKNIYVKKEFSKELKKIKEFYLNQGYADFKFRNIKIIVKEKNKLYFLIDIHEGWQHNINRIILNNGKRIIKFSKPIKNFSKSTIYNLSNTDKIKKKIINLLYNKGFLYIDTTMDPVNSGSGLTDLVFKTKSLKKSNINDVIIVNNNKTPEIILRDYFNFIEGNKPSIKIFEKQKKKICKTLNYASKIDYFIYKSLNSLSKKDLIINVTEKSENKFVAGLSFYKGFIGINTHADFGHFLGSSYDVIFKIHRTKRATEYNINCLEPKFWGYRCAINYNFFYKKDRIDETVKNFFSSKSKGIIITLSKKLSKHVKLDMSFGATKTSLKLPNEYNYFIIDEFIDRNGCNFKDYSIGFILSYNTMKKNKTLPTDITEGMNSNLALHLTIPPSDLRYFIFTYEFYMFKKIMKKCFLGLYINFMWGDKYDENSAEFPFFKYFQLTGKKKVRGYKDKTLGPRDYRNIPIGGNFLTLFKISLYLPTPKFSGSKNFRSYLFFDAGQVYNTSDYSFEEPLDLEDEQTYDTFLRYSTGITIHWKSPLGIPVEFVYAHAINPEFDDQIEKFSVHIYSTGKRPTK